MGRNRGRDALHNEVPCLLARDERDRGFELSVANDDFQIADGGLCSRSGGESFLGRIRTKQLTNYGRLSRARSPDKLHLRVTSLFRWQRQEAFAFSPTISGFRCEVIIKRGYDRLGKL